VIDEITLLYFIVELRYAANSAIIVTGIKNMKIHYDKAIKKEERERERERENGEGR